MSDDLPPSGLGVAIIWTVLISFCIFWLIGIVTFIGWLF